MVDPPLLAGTKWAATDPQQVQLHRFLPIPLDLRNIVLGYTDHEGFRVVLNELFILFHFFGNGSTVLYQLRKNRVYQSMV